MNRVKLVLCICITALSAIALTLAIQGSLKRLNTEYGHLSVNAVDAYSLAPLCGASVILPEFDMNGVSDKNGNVSFYNIPCSKNEALDKLLTTGFAQTTILCYCEGYQPFAMFYAQVDAGRMREGLMLYMFPEYEDSGCIIEAPPEEWVKELLVRYAPEKR